MLVINKMDVEGANEKYSEIKDCLKNLDGEYLVCLSKNTLSLTTNIIVYICSFSDAVSSYPDEIKPLKTIKFDKILKISAKTQPDDVKRVKHVLRELLDVNEELNNVIEHKPLKNLKEQLRERGPVLV